MGDISVDLRVTEKMSYILAFYSDVQGCAFHKPYLNRSEWMNQSISDGWRFWPWPWEALWFMEPLNFYYEELFRQVVEFYFGEERDFPSVFIHYLLQKWFCNDWFQHIFLGFQTTLVFSKPKQVFKSRVFPSSLTSQVARRKLCISVYA